VSRSQSLLGVVLTITSKYRNNEAPDLFGRERQ
jgi:hypothetical protein